ncbi:unnamed protein product [Rotaria socialis]|uniref:Uncharacterized protein n=1 Tax=Rotaria socialis TaxID=392032 RepID=A0A820US51_9BILA|nr:unnamed protein product [Rotaria socialis]CAF3496454.1 unnamed protein product [Rotaria socialis]CAF4376517.1 unnamed protein product [Rotaria socialis]CAF4489510.1 unnamed protein product [Rotaria socialis]CAF4549376.1 unnamed protein product [Rotaria socialis]
MENTDIISDHAQVNRTIKEERQCILNIIKEIKKTNYNPLLIQKKTILPDAIGDLAINYLLQMKILVLKTVEREDVPFIAKILGCKPITSLDHFQQDMVGSIDLVEEKLQLAQIKSLRIKTYVERSNVSQITSVAHSDHSVSMLLRSSSKLEFEEAARSVHDALFVIRI